MAAKISALRLRMPVESKLVGTSIATIASRREEVVRHHVAQRARRLVELCRARSTPTTLGGGDLHVVDAVAVPDRLEHAVGEAERHDRLHRLLAEEMIDPVDLALVQGLRAGLTLSALRGGDVVARTASPPRRGANGLGASFSASPCSLALLVASVAAVLFGKVGPAELISRPCRRSGRRWRGRR